MAGTKMEILDSQDELHVQNTDLSDSSFDEVDLSNSTFRDVDFSEAEFENVSFAGASIKDVNLSGALLENCAFEKTRINGVLLTDLFAAYEKSKRK